MIKNIYAKSLFRLSILLFIASTVFLYYVASRKNISSDNIPTDLKQDKPKVLNIQRTFSNSRTTPSTPKRLAFDGKVYRYGTGTEEIKLAVVLCGDRLNQTLVTLKSALVFSKKDLHFIMIVDDVNRNILKNELLEWPSTVLNRLSFEIHPIKFPSGREGEEWKKLFKLCACQRLFLPSLLHHIDSLLYVDTDILFMHPVENLWQNFHSMNSSHIAGLCPENEDFSTGWYNRFARHPFYEPLGINSGVMLMNLTRMRLFQWEKYLHPIMKEYKLNIVWGDQDIINIIFHFHPDKLHILPCEWNYRPDHCMYSSVCKTAEKNGIFVIHGSRGVFQNNKQPAFKAIYNIMSQFKLGMDDGKKVLDEVNIILEEQKNTNCGKYLSSIFLKMGNSSRNR